MLRLCITIVLKVRMISLTIDMEIPRKWHHRHIGDLHQALIERKKKKARLAKDRRTKATSITFE